MSAGRTGGSAFPIPIETLRWDDTDLHGMTLRDYFAAKALPAILAQFPHPENNDFTQLFELVGVMSYAMADAMLKAGVES